MNANKLFYNVPASKLKLKEGYYKDFRNIWEQTALPIGNGTLGLSVMGEVENETLILNHKTLWKGGPSPKRPDYSGANITTPDENGKMPYDYFTEIREEFQKGNDEKASELCEKLIGVKDGYGAYQCWGEFNFEPNDVKTYKNYERSLDLSKAVCSVSYDAKLPDGKKVTDTRTYFVSHPDRCVVMRFARENGKMNGTFFLTTDHIGELTYSDEGVLLHQGALEDNGMQFCLYAKVLTDGTLRTSENGFALKDATEITVILSAETDYLDNYPIYRTGETAEALMERVKDHTEKAAHKSYEELLETHMKDFASIYSRVSLDLKASGEESTDKLLYRYHKRFASNQRLAEELLYNYGRYLLISSTRENDILPSNLQGIWNCSNKPIWGSDYHVNVNLQMNYWPVYNGNMAECAKPLIRYIKAMVVPGRKTAEYYTNIASKDGEQNGFLFHTQCTPFGWTGPGWCFDWGWSPAVVPWILHNIYEYYEYTLDKQMLKDEIYPMLKETAEYFSKLLIPHNGRLVTAPCFSPENGPRTMGNTYEQVLLWQLYDNAIKSAKTLDVDEELCEKWVGILLQLKPYEIGADGQIKEWYHEEHLGEIGQKHHRHMSHLLGLYPCNSMNWYDNPDLIDAAVISMNDRTDASTGWSMGQKINSWARVGDGDRVLKIIGSLFEGGLYPNLFDVHPPFQIDGNFGYTAGVNEMLMQSHCKFIHLLPALPKKWADGKVAGLVARGNFTVDIAWEKGELTFARITANVGGKCKICYKNQFVEFDTVKGETYEIQNEGANRIRVTHYERTE